MYKGYTTERVGGCYKFYDPNGVACMTVTKEYLETRSQKDIIEELLKRRVPRKPKKEFKTSVKDGKLHIEIPCNCPCCNWYLGDECDFYKYHQCANCGQVIKWEMEN